MFKIIATKQQEKKQFSVKFLKKRNKQELNPQLAAVFGDDKKKSPDSSILTQLDSEDPASPPPIKRLRRQSRFSPPEGSLLSPPKESFISPTNVTTTNFFGNGFPSYLGILTSPDGAPSYLGMPMSPASWPTVGVTLARPNVVSLDLAKMKSHSNHYGRYFLDYLKELLIFIQNFSLEPTTSEPVSPTPAKPQQKNTPSPASRVRSSLLGDKRVDTYDRKLKEVYEKEMPPLERYAIERTTHLIGILKFFINENGYTNKLKEMANSIERSIVPYLESIVDSSSESSSASSSVSGAASSALSFSEVSLTDAQRSTISTIEQTIDHVLMMNLTELIWERGIPFGLDTKEKYNELCAIFSKYKFKAQLTGSSVSGFSYKFKSYLKASGIETLASGKAEGNIRSILSHDSDLDINIELWPGYVGKSRLDTELNKVKCHRNSLKMGSGINLSKSDGRYTILNLTKKETVDYQKSLRNLDNQINTIRELILELVKLNQQKDTGYFSMLLHVFENLKVLALELGEYSDKVGRKIHLNLNNGLQASSNSLTPEGRFMQLF